MKWFQPKFTGKTGVFKTFSAAHTYPSEDLLPPTPGAVCMYLCVCGCVGVGVGVGVGVRVCVCVYVCMCCVVVL